MEKEELKRMRELAIRGRKIRQLIEQKREDARTLTSPRLDGMPVQHNGPGTPPMQKSLEHIETLEQELQKLEMERMWMVHRLFADSQDLPSTTKAMGRAYYVAGLPLQTIARRRNTTKDKVWAKIRTFNKKILDNPPKT